MKASERKTRLRHVPFSFHHVYGCCSERTVNGDGEEGREISGRRERIDIAWITVYR